MRERPAAAPVVAPITAVDRDYLAELVYFTNDNRWIKIIRSLDVRIP